MDLKQYLPILSWFPKYKKKDLSGDLFSGLTVGVLLIPQGMAYAMIAGMPPIYGLYAAFLPQIIYSIFGTSRQLAVGPAAMIALLVGAGISDFAEAGTEHYIQLVILLTLMVGVFQLLFGILKMGFLVNFLSQPVISGYTSAAAIIIGLSQLKHLLGVDVPSSNLIHEIGANTFGAIQDVNLTTLTLGLTGIAILLAFKRYLPRVPGSLIIVVLSIVVVSIFQWDKKGVQTVGEIPSGLPSFSFPEMDWGTIKSLLSLSLIIALVGFMESISIAKAIQLKKRNYQVAANNELAALGLANCVGSFFGSFTVSGGLSRSAVNVQAGANTNLASIISGLLVGITLLFLTSLFYYLPNAVLAAVIMVAVFGLINVKLPLYLYRTNRKDFLMLLITFVFTLIFGVQIGIVTGVALSLGLVIHRSVYPHLAELGKLPDTNYYRNLSRFPEAVERKDALIFRFDSELYFANINFFREKLQKMIDMKGKELKIIVLNAQSIYNIDSSAIQGLDEIIEDCRQNGIEFYLTEVIGPVRDRLRKSGLLQKIGEDHFKMRVQDALDCFDNQDKSKSEYAIQTNR